MVLREGLGPRAQFHVIDAWQHLATFGADEDPADWPTRYRTDSGHFSIDSYRILTRHLRDRRLTPLPPHAGDSWS
jgi:hypothetical protein